MRYSHPLLNKDNPDQKDYDAYRVRQVFCPDSLLQKVREARALKTKFPNLPWTVIFKILHGEATVFRYCLTLWLLGLVVVSAWAALRGN